MSGKQLWCFWALAAVIVLLAGLLAFKKTRAWFKSRVKTLGFLPQYSKAICSQFVAIFWGASLPFLAYAIYSLFASPPGWLIWLAILSAEFLAGYYLWRSYHVRLIPKLALDSVETMYTTPKGPSVDEKRLYCQVVVNCATECPLQNCRGKLLSAAKWSGGKWEPTRIVESVDLWWSYIDGPTLLLEHGAPQRLNVFYVENISKNLFTWSKIRVRLAYFPADTLRFHVRVVADNCPAEYIYVTVKFGERWCDVSVESATFSAVPCAVAAGGTGGAGVSG